MTRTARIVTTLTLTLGISALAGVTVSRPGDGNTPIRQAAAPVVSNQVKTKAMTAAASYIRG